MCHDGIGLRVNNDHLSISKHTQEIYWVWGVRDEWHCLAWGLNFSSRFFVWTLIYGKYGYPWLSISKVKCLYILLEVWGTEFTWNSLKDSIKGVHIENLNLTCLCHSDIIFELTYYSWLITGNLFDLFLLQIFVLNLFWWYRLFFYLFLAVNRDIF
jgi:hypothetical protein